MLHIVVKETLTYYVIFLTQKSLHLETREEVKDNEHSDDHRTPVKSREFGESMSASLTQTTDLANKRSRQSPEEIRGYKKSKSGSDGSKQVQKISVQ